MWYTIFCQKLNFNFEILFTEEEMRYARREKILELIQNHDISTQEKLAAMLKDEGFEVTQATVSRDIKELKLIKTVRKNGRSCYSIPDDKDHPSEKRFSTILRETVQSLTPAENIIVIKTLSGCAGAAAEAIDNVDLKATVGTLAGDNTIFLVVDSTENVPAVMAQFSEILA